MKKIAITLIAIFGLVSISIAQQGDSPRPIKKELRNSRPDLMNTHKTMQVQNFKKYRKEKFKHSKRKAPLRRKVVRHHQMVR